MQALYKRPCLLRGQPSGEDVALQVTQTPLVVLDGLFDLQRVGDEPVPLGLLAHLAIVASRMA